LCNPKNHGASALTILLPISTAASNPSNDWLARQAIRNEARGDSRTYISIDADTSRIAGYYSLASSAVSRKQVGGWLSRNAPEPVPVVLLGRLAVDNAARGTGLGGDLLTHALRNATLAANLVGARSLVAEAIDETAAQFYLHAGLRRSAVRADLLYAPLR
jgi:predicted GNAT family N-acyltransferase